MCSLATTVLETVITQNLQSAYGVRVALQIILFYTWLGDHRLGYVACNTWVFCDDWTLSPVVLTVECSGGNPTTFLIEKGRCLPYVTFCSRVLIICHLLQKCYTIQKLRFTFP